MRCDLIFEPWECRLLEELQPLIAPETMQGQKKKPLGLATANVILSRLGGALNRNPRERPGPQTILRGHRRFRDIGLGYRIGKGEPVDALVIGVF
jgi:hypothetical protein